MRWEDQAARKKERADSKMTARVWTKAPISYFDHYLDDREPHLFSIALDGGEPAAITRMSGYHLSKQEYDAFSYDISPDGLEVAFAAERRHHRHRQQLRPHPARRPAAASRRATSPRPTRPTTARRATAPTADVSRSRSSACKWFYADRTRLMIFDRAAGTTVGVTENWDRSVDGLVWERDSRTLVRRRSTMRARCACIASGSTAARPTAVTRSFELRRAGAVEQRQGAGRDPPEFHRAADAGVARRRARGAATQAVDVQRCGARRHSTQGKVESVTYKGAKDDDIQMWVVYPPGFDASKKYPVYMLLHGGPHNGIIDARAVALERARCSRAGATS